MAKTNNRKKFNAGFFFISEEYILKCGSESVYDKNTDNQPKETKSLHNNHEIKIHQTLTGQKNLYKKQRWPEKTWLFCSVCGICHKMPKCITRSSLEHIQCLVSWMWMATQRKLQPRIMIFQHVLSSRLHNR